MEIETIVQNCKEEVQNFLNKNSNGTIIIWGATATGKSKLSIHLSQYFNTEIIGSDSRQIYKYMNIGTDKISKQIREQIPHHMIDIISPDETYTAGQWKKQTEEIIKKISNKGNIPIIVGGTGLYIDTIYKNFSLPESVPNNKLREELYKKEDYDPGYLRQELQKIDPIQASKIHYKSIRYLVRALEIYYTTGLPKSEIMKSQEPTNPILMMGLRREKEDTNRRIDHRVEYMIENGLIEEVKRLLDSGYDETLQSMQGIGYRQTAEYIKGNLNKEDLIIQIKQTTHKFAKRQRTRFRRYIKDKENNSQNKITHKIRNLS